MGFRKMGELRTQRFAAPGVFQFLTDQGAELRDVHLQQHGLDWADGRRRHGQGAEAEADQGHGLEGASADLAADRRQAAGGLGMLRHHLQGPDRKSTRLNSSHANISYAVFCLKKKKHDKKTTLVTSS